jgi:hypothetical protein
MHMKQITHLVLGFGIFALVLGMSASAFADFCVNADNGVAYRLQFGSAAPIAGTPLVITGSRTVSTLTTPVFGTLISTADATLIGLTEVFNFGSGFFSNPAASTVMNFPKAAGGQPRYDTTFFGNGDPHNVMGGLNIVACPASEGVSQAVGPAVDPNAKH